MGRPSGPDEMYCPQCGELIDRDSQFCTYCGAHIEASSKPSGDESETTADPSRGGAAVPPSARRRGRGRGHSGRDRKRDRQRQPDSRQHRSDHPPGAGPAPRTDTSNHTSEETSRFRQTRIGAESLSLPTPEESLFRAVGVAVGLGGLGILILGTLSLLIGGVTRGFGLPTPLVIVVATGIGQYVGFVGLSVVYLRNREFEWPDVRSYVGLRLPTLKELAVFIVGLVVMYILLFVVAGIVAQFLPEPAENEGAQQLTSSTSTLAYIGVVAFMYLVVGPCEEFLFRGVVQNRLRERLTAVPAILIASATFASVHVIALVGSPLSAILVTLSILFVPAIVLGGVYEYTGNLVVPTLLHSTHNSLLVTLFFFGPEESTELLTWGLEFVLWGLEFLTPVFVALS